MGKVVGIIFGIALLGLGGLVGWKAYQQWGREEQGPARKGQAVVAVDIARVRRGEIRDIQQFTGTLLPRSEFTVAPKIAGRLEKLLVDIGDRVVPGQLVAVLEGQEYAQQVEQARAERDVASAGLEEAGSSLAAAKSEYDRVQALLEQKIASASEFDEAQAKYKATQARQKLAVAQVEQKEAALRTAELRLAYTQITATWGETGTGTDGSQGRQRPGAGNGEESLLPATGSPLRQGYAGQVASASTGSRLIGERFVDEGAMLRANDPIVSVLDISVLKAIIHVTERDYPKVHVGQGVTLSTDAFPGQVFPGKVVRMAPLVKETSREARIEIEVNNPQGLLRPGMFARAEIEFSRQADVTLIPLAALANRNGRQGVFLADLAQKRARFVPLTVGVVQGEVAQVLPAPAAATQGAADPNPEPLSGWVVVLGQHLLEDTGSGAPILLPAPEGTEASGGRGGARGPNPAEARGANADSQPAARGGRP